MSQEEDTQSRIIKLTEKGLSMFQDACKDHQKKIDNCWTKVEDDILTLKENSADIKKLRTNEYSIKANYEEYVKYVNEFQAYLKRCKSEPAEEELVKLTSDLRNAEALIRKSMLEIKQVKQDLMETASAISVSPSEAKQREDRVKFIQRQAALEKERAKLIECELHQKAELERQKTDIEIQLRMLKQEEQLCSFDQFSLPEENVMDRTNHYVETLEQPVLSCGAVKPDKDSIVSDLASFLLRKQLVPERFSVFDDKPESYCAWKSSFISIINDIKASSQEEIEVLINKLSGRSKEVAKSVRNAYPGNATSALELIWERLDEMYGRPEVIESSLQAELNSFRYITANESKRLYDLLNILLKIESVKNNTVYSKSLAYYDSSAGVNPILAKLPHSIQEKWISRAAAYKRSHCVAFPPFTFFVSFIKEMSQIRNDPAFIINKPTTTGTRNETRFRSVSVHTNKFEVKEDVLNGNRCPYHKAQHSIQDCRAFRSKPLADRINFLKSKRICLKCCESTHHKAYNCELNVKCKLCQSSYHSTAMHPDGGNPTWNPHGGERRQQPLTPRPQPVADVTTKCTTFCNDKFRGRSCSKTVLVDVRNSQYPDKVVKVYAILDDQSNQSLASPELLDALNVEGTSTQYTLISCSGSTTMYGRRANGLSVTSFDHSVTLDLPTVIECDEIPNETSEIPTPDIARSYTHLNSIASMIPEVDKSLKIGLLIGRDLIEAHHVQKQIIGPKGMPFAVKLGLGWVIIGEVCLGRLHQRNSVNVKKVSILNDGGATCNEPCHNYFHVKEQQVILSDTNKKNVCDFYGDNVFRKTPEDETPGLSVEDKLFLQLMEGSFQKDSEGLWSAPLPFRKIPDNMPNNRLQALRRAQMLHSSLQKDTLKRDHFVTFMGKVLNSGAAEIAPVPRDNCYWYLPLFGVRNPRKPNQIRGVFDSSAVYEGVSLNGLLMSGPDLMNSLLGILLRFRKDEVAMTADVEQMFYRFHVHEDYRDYLRFFWYRGNDPEDKLIEYRMKAHVFGNCPSPAIAAYGLRKSVENSDSDVKDFVYRNFYVDDGLISLPDEASAISLMKRTQSTLKKEGGMRLHKITSNKDAVMNAFETKDHGTQMKEIDKDETVVRSLGLCWNLQDDTFVFNVPEDEKPFTRRGLLSTVNSLFDPLGFIAPITVSGKILLREATSQGVDWDEPLSLSHLQKWTEWRASLYSLNGVAIPRMMGHTSVSTAKKLEVHIFSDASEQAIAAAAYVKVEDAAGSSSVNFLMGKGKLAPPQGHTIPRLELCGAVLATEVAEILSTQLDLPLQSMQYYTDSKVVLGYIRNRTRRFYTYVSNRVDRILRISSAEQWNYISTDKNPADSCTRCITSVVDIMELPWIKGPQWLCDVSTTMENLQCFPLVDPEKDLEVRPLVTVVNAEKSNTPVGTGLGTKRFERFSKWKSLVHAIMFLQRACQVTKGSSHCETKDIIIGHAEALKRAENCVIREVQKDHFSNEIKCLSDGKKLPKNSNISTLSPILDEYGLLRVGGRLHRAAGQLPAKEINPILLPKNSHVSTLLIRHFHEKVKHQGRLFTEGSLRSGGFWVIGAKRMIASQIHNCVTCRRLRRGLETQKMADVPVDRITPGPPFTSVGVDAFGPWEVSTRKTRGGAANSKRWGIIFTCLASRAVHIEVVEEMSSSSFINALRRFLTIRGPVKCIRSDRGTNFIGASEEMKVNTVKVEDGPVLQFLNDSNITWIFNVPHASHMGGVWERMIGMTRRILDSMLLESRFKQLTHETLTTFLCEVCAIINSRPITTISSDPDSPMIISPSVILTGKVDYLPVISDSLSIHDIYRAQWKHVQVLADLFWRRWQKEYLNTLQPRRKWKQESLNLKTDDVVLMKDSTVHRNNWPLAIVERVLESGDGLVRKVLVRTIRDGNRVVYTRPVHELVLLQSR